MEYINEGSDTGLHLTFCPYGCMCQEGETCEHGYRPMHEILGVHRSLGFNTNFDDHDR